MTISKNNTYVEAVLQKIKEAYALKTDASLARFLDMKPNTLAMQKKRGSLNWIRIFQKCSNLDKNWLLHHDKNQPRSNKPPLLLPYIHQSNLATKKALSDENLDSNKLFFPSYLIPNALKDQINNCVIVKIDQIPKISIVNAGDVILMYTEVNKPQEDTYYMVEYNGNTIITRIDYRSDRHLILKDQNVDPSQDPLPLDHEQISLIGQVLWMGNQL